MFAFAVQLAVVDSGITLVHIVAQGLIWYQLYQDISNKK